MMHSTELDDVDLDNSEEGRGGRESGNSIAWQIFSNSKKPKITNEDSFLYPILKTLDQTKIVFTDLNFDQFKTLFKSLYDTQVVQAFYTIFKSIAWPLWWFGVGFIAPGAIMFLGLFLLKLAIFGTVTAITAFIVTSTVFGVLNIGCNFFLNAKNAVYSQVASDLQTVQKLIDELDLYLEKQEQNQQLNQLEHEVYGNNLEKLAKLDREADIELQQLFENQIYVTFRAAHNSINKNINENWFLTKPVLKVLNVLNNVFHAINSRVLFGFGCFIFVMLGLNMLFPLSMPIIVTAVVLASISCIIHTGLVAHDISTAENTHTANVALIKQKLGELDQRLDTYQAAVPSVKALNSYDDSPHQAKNDNDDQRESSVENTPLLQDDDAKKPENLKSFMDSSKLKQTQGYYKLRFIRNLQEVADRTTKNPRFVDDFVSYASSAPVA